MNKQLILNHLHKLSDMYMKTGDSIRAGSFSRACNSIMEAPIDIIESSKDLKGLFGVGPSTLKEIDEFISNGVTTSRLSKLENEFKSVNSEESKKKVNNIMERMKKLKNGK